MADNVIPGTAYATFNIRFNNKHTSNSIKNQSDISSQIKLQTSPISASSSIKFRRQSHVQAKCSMFKNPSKTCCFRVFLEHPLMLAKANTRHATHSKNHQPHFQKICFSSQWSAFSIIRGISSQVRNSDVLGKVLGSILASISDHVGVQNDVRTASKTHHEKKDANMSPTWAPTWPQEASQDGPRGLPRRPKRLPKRPPDRSYA